MNELYQQSFERILNYIAEQILCLDLDRRIVWANEQLIQAVQRDRSQLIGTQCYQILMKRNEPCEECPLEIVQRTNQPRKVELFDHEDQRFRMTLFPIADEEGQVVRIVVFPMNISGQPGEETGLMRGSHVLRTDNLPLRAKEEDLNQALMLADAGFWEWDMKNHRLQFDESWLKLLGYPSREEIDCQEIVHPEDRSRVLKNLNDHIMHETPFYQSEYRLRTRSGEWKWFLAKGKVVDCDTLDEPTRMIGITQDITDQKSVEERLKEIAYFDTLTRLPNRTYIKNHIQHVIEGESSLALLYVDLDRFKRVNDTLGHKVGDQILQMVVQRLLEVRRKHITVGRINGDEFVVVFENYQDKDDLRALATQLLQIFARPFVLAENTIHLSVSIGISVFPEDGLDADTLMRHAGIAMDYIKCNMGDNFSFYTKQLSDTIARKLYFETEIRQAVEQDEFTLYYQPQVHLQTGQLVGVEALVRWNHPKLGFISPMEFIPVAEETGLIDLVDEWVLTRACQQHRIWRETGFFIGRMAVNVSIHQFRSVDFYEMVCGVLKETEMNPQYLELEITESVVKDVKQLSNLLFRLRRLGVKIAVDDFGTGYSSLNLLHSLPLDTLKIDRSFVAESCNPSSQTLVKTMVDIGRNLNFAVIAEGVETEEQVRFLAEAGCPIGQGFYYSKPIPSSDLRRHFGLEISGF